LANPKEKYTYLKETDAINEIDKLRSNWNTFVNNAETSEYKTSIIDYTQLVYIIDKVDKRKDYYYYFHQIEKDDMCEYREIALTAFWILKLKPFKMANEEAKLYGCENEKFAMYSILAMLHRTLGTKFKMPNKKFIEDIEYSFKCRDVSKESMIDLVYGFSECLSL